jgi:uncharacterized protein (TIGR00255 family)
MTGFGKANCEINSKRISIEIKSLNSKQLDLNLKIPSIFKDKEVEFRTEITKELLRGKVDFYIGVETITEELPITLNSQIIGTYYKQLSALATDLNIALPADIMHSLLRLPDAFKAERPELPADEWEIILKATKQAIVQLNEFRDQEGNALAKDIEARINLITLLCNNLLPFETQRIEKMKARIKQQLNEIVGTENIDNNRFEQELIYYIEKLDITEEKVRLDNHCTYFKETLFEEDSNGKKLGFITQEIGREINTIGSKSNDSSMQKIVVQMKDELEKIKEQINNIL